MFNHTQDIVCSIQGAEELLHKSEEVFHNKEKSVTFIQNGFEVHVEGLPYFFTVSCFEEIGWNVFLTSISGSIDDDEETDLYYEQLEDAVDIVNAHYYQDDNNDDATSYNFFKLKTVTTDKLSVLPEVDEIQDTGKYVLKVSFKEFHEMRLELGYSKIFKRWYYEFFNHASDSKESLLKQDSMRQYLEEVDYLIGNFNHSM
ncbi:hypothetical protein CVD28_01525 [Bacillus sp. M6-12]|uniref:hypothetical protein n=1 Tax=Bacillus sp. M6-12 TaxID=2054166 RepID=UPI000C76030F|nr:hypothetical protein [Bacillus sp. M6-12]PLS19115.1 hypothetical protein CVD28_01525 [Bacillus sp. M6-12]